MDHKNSIKGFSNLNELAIAVGNLRYDALAEFLKALSDKLLIDSDADLNRKRLKLAESLLEVSWSIEDAADQIRIAWDICKPHM